VHDVLRVAGGANVFAERPSRYPTIALEELRAAMPEVILLPDEPYRFRPAHLADFASLADVPAVREGRVHFVDGKLLTWHGPRVGDALARLPPLLRAPSASAPSG
jgi:ABC-type Fe3+-hydroxamate transport system substrate-binding protein